MVAIEFSVCRNTMSFYADATRRGCDVRHLPLSQARNADIRLTHDSPAPGQRVPRVPYRRQTEDTAVTRQPTSVIH